VLGAQYAGLEVRAAIDRDALQFEVDGLAIKEALDSLSELGDRGGCAWDCARKRLVDALFSRGSGLGKADADDAGSRLRLPPDDADRPEARLNEQVASQGRLLMSVRHVRMA